MERSQHHQYCGGRCISIFGYDSTVLSQKYIRSVLSDYPVEVSFSGAACARRRHAAMALTPPRNVSTRAFCDLPASDANALSGFPLVVTRSEETAAAVAAASTISFAGVEGFTGWLSQLRDAVYARPVSQERSTVRPRAPTNTCRQSPKADPLSEVPLLVRRVREY